MEENEDECQECGVNLLTTYHDDDCYTAIVRETEARGEARFEDYYQEK